MISIIQNNHDNGDKTFDLVLGGLAIWTDAQDLETAKEYQKKLFDTLDSMGGDFIMDDEVKEVNE